MMRKPDSREIRFGRVRSEVIQGIYDLTFRLANRYNVDCAINGDLYREYGPLQPATLRDQKMGVSATFKSRRLRERSVEVSITHAQRWTPVMLLWIEGWKRSKTYVLTGSIETVLQSIESEIELLIKRCIALPALNVGGQTDEVLSFTDTGSQ